MSWEWRLLGTRASRPHRDEAPVDKNAGGTPAFPGGGGAARAAEGALPARLQSGSVEVTVASSRPRASRAVTASPGATSPASRTMPPPR